MFMVRLSDLEGGASLSLIPEPPGEDTAWSSHHTGFPSTGWEMGFLQKSHYLKLLISMFWLFLISSELHFLRKWVKPVCLVERLSWTYADLISSGWGDGELICPALPAPHHTWNSCLFWVSLRLNTDTRKLLFRRVLQMVKKLETLPCQGWRKY